MDDNTSGMEDDEEITCREITEKAIETFDFGSP
jgi:hypothetical protein